LKNSIASSVIKPGHRDFELLSKFADELFDRAGGRSKLAYDFAAMLRQNIDDVIQSAKTGRRSYDELEKTEKTYIGTRVEIALRAMLDLKKGKLDTVLLGYDVDIKHTMGNNWMIPTEAINHPCMLIAADENTSLCYFGLFIARIENLTQGQNKDSKRNISADGFSNIFWIFEKLPYPKNFWKDLSSEAIERIFSGKTGNSRVAALFRELQGVVIGRDIIETVARQKDFMRRLRSDDKKGTRDQLKKEGILVLSGSYDKETIKSYGLPLCGESEFIAYKP